MYCALSAVEFRVREEWVRGLDGVEVVDCFPQHKIGDDGMSGARQRRLIQAIHVMQCVIPS